MHRIKIALLTTALVIPGAAAFAQDDRGVVKADPTYSDDTIEALRDGQDVIETPGGDERRVLMDEDDDLDIMDDDVAETRRTTDDDRGVVKADPTYSDDTIEALRDGQDVIETPGGEG